MSYHSHKLNSSHSHIIGRTDPITGDMVQENDKVVFCAVCKSCFLEDSWGYMNDRHCEQFMTLNTVPVLQSRLIIRRSKEMIAELLHTGADSNIMFLLIVMSFIISALSFGFVISLFITFFVGVLSSIITSRDFFKELTGANKNDVRLFKNRIEIGKDSFSWNDVKQIKYQRESQINYHSEGVTHNLGMPSLLIYFESGKFLNKGLPTKSREHTGIFLHGLEKISHFKEVFFYSEDNTELRTMMNIKSQSKGNIEIGKPRK
ncbi:hypothetical protein ACE193_01075 [Bernardetia sp. OM2101]|uniref:hypothetical protein n=1 Tax=Bernardetia sp. OM2101 TaxID=3344876 RepID=UPI0035D0762C